MAKKIITIDEIPNEIHENVLDLIGNEFKFDLVKGMAEWLKNSVDAYRRNSVKQEDQHVVFRFTDDGVNHPIVECIDFIGMSGIDIEKALKIWFDPNAAKRGKGIKVFGGHGNGGKFFMRQMFEESRFITYKDGVLNVFGFNEKKKYGFAKGYKDKKMTPAEALNFAEISNMPIAPELKEKVLNGETGFTTVQGVKPKGIRTKFRITAEVERLKNHPQSRRILQRSKVAVVYNGYSLHGLLQPDELEPLPEFSEPRVIYIPETLTTQSGKEKVVVRMANQKYEPGKLILRTSSDALHKSSRFAELNRIDILGEVGVIGSYQLSELGVMSWPYAHFVYGEFSPAHEGEPSILEDSENDCVTNDRSKLISNDTTKALLAWIAEQIDVLANEIGATEREKQKLNQKEITSKFNDVLNEWKNKHMSKIMSDLFGEGDKTGSGNGNEDVNIGTEVTPPLNGFDFKYPRAEIQKEVPTKITLKVSVPQSLPIGATIFLSSTSEKVILTENKLNIKSDYLKATAKGQEVAFLPVEVTGLEEGIEADIVATAGKLSATIHLVVIPMKEKKSGKSFPKVLLSGHDKDPLEMAAGGILHLTERDPVVYQRPPDVAANIYWINTSSPMASKIYDRFKFESIQWRNFLFDRYIDIFVKEAIRELQKRSADNFTADSVDLKIDEVVRKIHLNASQDLDQFLFDENYVIKNE